MPDASGFKMHDKAETVVEWQTPALAILNRSAAPAPDLPLDVFGSFWGAWIARAAEGANAPPDFIVMPLLATVSALIGNARWANAWKGWAEPPALWCASVGNPSSGKSSGASTVIRDVLRPVEKHMARDYRAEIERWSEVEAVSRAVHKQWEKDVGKALKNSEAVPPKPDAATPPPRPVRPRASISDATIEGTWSPALQLAERCPKSPGRNGRMVAKPIPLLQRRDRSSVLAGSVQWWSLSS